MLDFASSLYLGLRHASGTLRPWTSFTTGVPAAYATHRAGMVLARRLADLQGCECATLAPSTLHLFWDLFGTLSEDGSAVYVDAGTYPIAWWGVERASGRGVPVRNFAHHDPEALRRSLERDAARGLRPIVVADGFCPACGGFAPIGAYLECVRFYRGCLVLDDTQALGIFGHSPGPEAPYGRGGGGSLQYNEVMGSEVLLVSSLAKGLGVPVAVLSGSETMVRLYQDRSETRVHCSPPSIPVIHAAETALSVNDRDGDALRSRLAHLVRYFRERLRAAGLSASGGLFPLQTLAVIPGVDVARLYDQLRRAGIRSVLHRSRGRRRPAISFLLNVRHAPRDISRAVETLASAARGRSTERSEEKGYASIA